MTSYACPARIVPFIQWPGGKTKMLKNIVERLPKSFNRYYEPFIGGGAVLLRLRHDDCVISDANPFLVNLWHCVAYDVEQVITELKSLDRVPFTKETYSWRRDMFNKAIANNEQSAFSAALFLWMTKRSYGGVLRFNRSGKCNSTFKLDANIGFDEQNILAVSDYLRNSVDVRRPGDFSATCDDVQKGDFVFFDPPYTDCCHSYNGVNWRMEDHERLAEFCRVLDKKGAFFMTTYNDSAFLRDLYHDFHVDVVSSQWGIKGTKTVDELIITNYDYFVPRLF